MGRDVRAGPPLIQSDLSVPGVSSRSGNTFVGFCTGECLDEAVPVSWTIGRLNQAAFIVSTWRTSVGVL